MKPRIRSNCNLPGPHHSWQCSSRAFSRTAKLRCTGSMQDLWALGCHQCKTSTFCLLMLRVMNYSYSLGSLLVCSWGHQLISLNFSDEIFDTLINVDDELESNLEIEWWQWLHSECDSLSQSSENTDVQSEANPAVCIILRHNFVRFVIDWRLSFVEGQSLSLGFLRWIPKGK